MSESLRLSAEYGVAIDAGDTDAVCELRSESSRDGQIVEHRGGPHGPKGLSPITTA